MGPKIQYLLDPQQLLPPWILMKFYPLLRHGTIFIPYCNRSEYPFRKSFY